MAGIEVEQPSPRPNVKWRAGEIPQSPGELATNATQGGSPTWHTRPTAPKRKTK